MTLRAGLVAVSDSFGGSNFTFCIPEDVTVTSPIDAGGVAGANPPRTATFSGLTLYQGTLLTKSWVVNGNSDQRFLIENSNVDIDTLKVDVRKSGASAGLSFF